MAKVTMALNVPLVIEQAKYLDWMPPGQFGSQLRLKGTIGGDPQAVLYLPGKHWATGRALINGGVIEEMKFDQEPEEAVNIPLLKTSFVLTNKQVLGKNYGNMVVSAQGELPGLAQVAPQATKGRNAGPLLPNEEPGYLEALAGQGPPNSFSTRPDGVDVTQGVSRDVPITETQKDKVERMYMESLHFVVNEVVPVWEAIKVSYDAAAMNAAVAVVVIQRGGR